MGTPSEGEKPPLVTSPIKLSLESYIKVPSLAGALPLGRNPNNLLTGPLFNSPLIALPPIKSALLTLSLQRDHLRPASIGEVFKLISCP